MEFGVINTFNLFVVLCLALPNITNFLFNKKRYSRSAATIDIITTFMSVLVYVLPIGINKFGFSSSEEMLIYLFYNIAFILIYIGIWLVYKKQNLKKQAILLIVIPTVIFLLNGLILKHILLSISSIVFAVTHIYSIIQVR